MNFVEDMEDHPALPLPPLGPYSGISGAKRNRPVQTSLPSFPLPPHGTPAALLVCSRQGVLLPNPSSLQDESGGNSVLNRIY